jgi:CBS domain-containing protein
MAADFLKSHARKVVDVMTREVVVATPDTPLRESLRCSKRIASNACRS